MMTKFFTQQLCFLLPFIVTSIRIREIEVPRYHLAGEDVQLNCTYDLKRDGGQVDPLHAVKWYRGADHFYQFSPTRSSRPKFFVFDGLKVDLSRSIKSSVVLTNVDEKTSGVFRCEVMGDKPYFETDSKNALMTVIEPPKWGPKIQGVKTNSQVRTDDQISVRCLISDSRPAANLTWLLNGRISPVAMETASTRTADSFGRPLIEKKFDLRLDRTSFVKGTLQIECRAEVFDVWSQSDKIVLLDINRPKPAGIGWWFSSGCERYSSSLSVFMTIEFIILWMLFRCP